MPSFLIPMTFLGQPCGFGMTEGVNPEMYERLQRAEAVIRAAYEALPPKQRLDAATGRGKATLAQWCGTQTPHICWRPHGPHHSSGAAIDVNLSGNPYVVTRNGSVSGGWGGPQGARMRERALLGYDRAMEFSDGPGAPADVGARRPNESTESVWRRFMRVSDALAAYLSLAIDAGPAQVSRPPIEDAEGISEDDLLVTIPEGERLAQRRAVARLGEVLQSAEFRAKHPVWALSPQAQYLRIVRDYELVRTPMIFGDHVPAPALTHNPARGFLNLRSEVVIALCDQGLRWGACDFGVRADGSSENGAMMHFDLADDGGYPEIPSLLRFG